MTHEEIKKLEAAIPRNLRALRGNAGLTQEDMAEVLNVHKNSYASWEAGSRTPTIRYLAAAAIFYRCSLDAICMTWREES